MQLKRIYFGENLEKKPPTSIHTAASSEDLEETDEQFRMKAYLDVIADSGTVECFFITKQEMQYFSDSQLKNIYDTLVQETEPDRYMHQEKVKQKREAMIHDQQDKLEKVSKRMIEQKIEKYGAMAALKKM